MEDGRGPSTYEERVSATRKRFILRIEQTLDDVLSALKTETPVETTETRARKVHRMLHDMAGNAAMLDLCELAQKLRQGVDIAETADHGRRQISERETAAIQEVVEDARVLGNSLTNTV